MVKIAPETAIKLTMNDVLKRVVAEDVDEITPGERMVAGGLAGATAQVRACVRGGERGQGARRRASHPTGPPPPGA